MKKTLLILMAIVGIFPSAELFAQNTSATSINFPKMDVSPLDLILLRNQKEEPIMRVLYSRPQRRNREIFGELVPHGRVWRTGANEATEVNLYQDIIFGGKKVKAGNYTLYTIPEKDEWTIILNNQTNTWGAYNYDASKDVARVKVPVKKSKTPIDALSMTFVPQQKNEHFVIGWGDTYVEIPISSAN